MTIERTPRPRALLIAGPTASGKSALALRLARQLDGEIINADAMQVYRDLSILTARPAPADMASAPHALYGTIDGATTHSVSRWLVQARAAIVAAEAAGRLPILVGGTGLYFKALTQGLSDIPAVPDDIRAAVRSWAEGQPAEHLHAELARRDPATAGRLRPTDPQRILRALEVFEATGESLSAFQARREKPVLEANAFAAFALKIPRDVLRARIDARFGRMVDEGALEEVASLEARGLDPTFPVMRAIGVPPLRAHLAGDVSLAEAMDVAKTASRQYLKRQETFLRHQLPAFRPVAAEDAESIILQACRVLPYS